MSTPFRSHFAAAVIGGLVVGGGLVALGFVGRPHTETIYEEAPVAAQPAASPTDPRLTAHDIYQRNAPGVVYVRAKLVEQIASPFNLFHARESDTSTGSGFLVDGRGDILTDFHVIEGAARSGGVTVEFENATIRRATVVAVDSADDLAVLRVDPRRLPPVRPLARGDSTSVRVGDPTFAIGNPFGVDRTLSSGIVSALQHQIHAADGRTIDNVIQTDQPVDAGNAGGPLLDANGQVIGINSQVAIGDGQPGTGQRLAFAIPIDTADAILAKVDRQTMMRIAYLGVGPTASRPVRAGAVVASLDHNGPAAASGVRIRDVIERLNGMTVTSIRDVLALVSTYSPGQTVVLQVRRGHRQRVLPVVLGSRSVSAPGS